MCHHFSSRHKTRVKTATMRRGAMLAVSRGVLMASGAVLANVWCNTAKSVAVPEYPRRIFWENRENHQFAILVGGRNDEA
jgi:hypothetical protein